MPASDKHEKSTLDDLRLYPHFKLTRERFPRLLATRRVETDDEAEYFGAFLPETGVRFLIDFLNKTFRLRTCEIDVDGSFDVPCTQFYRQRCTAPCVASLCRETEYAEQAALVRLFLRGDLDGLEKLFLEKIERAAADLDFERAAGLRDRWLAAEKLLTEKRWNFRLDDAVDTFEFSETEEDFVVHLVTMRGRRTLGKRTFAAAKTTTGDRLLAEIIRRFYRFHAPKEIRVSRDFAERRAVAAELGERFGRAVKITVLRAGDPKALVARALGRARHEHEFRSLRRAATADGIKNELRGIFELPETPARLEGFDVAHISGRDFVAARSVWRDGRFCGKEYGFWFSGEASELATMRRFVERRFSADNEKRPSLVLIDGGRAHLEAARKGLESLGEIEVSLVAAVKPRGRHAEISHFLTLAGARVEFDGRSAAHRLLQTLRDEAHDLSNEIHRQRREMAHFYELAAILPSLGEGERRALLQRFGSLKAILEAGEKELAADFSASAAHKILVDLENYRRGFAPAVEPVIVPLRYTDENGDAQDLRPLAGYRPR